jgi:hypothetical protein
MDGSTLKTSKSEMQLGPIEYLVLPDDAALRMNLKEHEGRTYFAFPKVKLLVEIDGGYHDRASSVEVDAQKDALAKRYGYTLLRFNTRQALHHTRKTADTIIAKLQELSPSSPPGFKRSGTLPLKKTPHTLRKA